MLFAAVRFETRALRVLGRYSISSQLLELGYSVEVHTELLEHPSAVPRRMLIPARQAASQEKTAES